MEVFHVNLSEKFKKVKRTLSLKFLGRNFWKKKPSMTLYTELPDLYELLESKGYKTDLYDPFSPSLSLDSLEDGLIPEYYRGEDLTAVRYYKGDEGRDLNRLHVRAWRKRDRIEVLAHYEIFPDLDMDDPDLVEVIEESEKHLSGETSNYRRGLEMLVDDLEGSLGYTLPEEKR